MLNTNKINPNSRFGQLLSKNEQNNKDLDDYMKRLDALKARMNKALEL